MSNQQFLEWCVVVCIVIVLLRKFGFYTERLAKTAQHAPVELPEFVICDTPVEAQNRKEEISQFVSQCLGESRDRLKPDLRFVDDLRVPPGDLGLLLDRVEEYFGVAIHRKNTRTLGDLLALVKVRQPQD